MMEIEIKKLNDTAITPTRGSREAAGNDLYSLEDATIRPGEVHKFGVGFAAAIPPGYFGAIFSRSGMSTNRGLTVSTGVSVIDSDYRGEIFVGLRNESDIDQTVRAGDRIAQLVIIPYQEIAFRSVDRLPETERGRGGFGSSGK